MQRAPGVTSSGNLHIRYSAVRLALFSDVFTDTEKMPEPIWREKIKNNELVRFNQGGYICLVYDYEDEDLGAAGFLLFRLGKAGPSIRRSSCFFQGDFQGGLVFLV